MAQVISTCKCGAEVTISNDGTGVCPRCGHVVDCGEVNLQTKARELYKKRRYEDMTCERF